MEVELRLDAIAAMIQHEDYRVASERSVSGTQVLTIRIGVGMSLAGGRNVRDVGFTVVLASGDRWLVPIVELAKITSS